MDLSGYIWWVFVFLVVGRFMAYMNEWLWLVNVGHAVGHPVQTDPPLHAQQGVMTGGRG